MGRPLNNTNGESPFEPTGSPIDRSDLRTNMIVMLVTFVVGIGLMGLQVYRVLGYRLIRNSF